MSKQNKPRWERLSTAAAISLHAFPTLFCRSRSLQPDSSAANLLALYRLRLLTLLANMPFWERALVVFVWPPVMVAWALGLTLANGAYVARRYHRGMLRQLVDQLVLAFGDGVPPKFYYEFELHEAHNRARAAEYLHRAHLKEGGLYKVLYQSWPDRSRQAKVLNDKIAFDRVCRTAQLPVPRLVALAADGALRWGEETESAPPPISLFLKPRKANGGRGAERWVSSEGRFAGPGGVVLDTAGLAAHLVERACRGDFLVQQCLVNHPELRGLTAGALSTVRGYTFWNESGDVEYLFAMLRMSRDRTMLVDNVCRGGLAAAVDPETGTLGPATDSSILARTGWLDRHPVTGAQIRGIRVPFWSEAKSLMIAAHRALASPFLIGWDIAITAEGPVIIEGNKAPDIEIEQRLDGPWGNQRFGQLLLHHLKAAPGQQDLATVGPNRAVDGDLHLA